MWGPTSTSWCWGGCPFGLGTRSNGQWDFSMDSGIGVESGGRPQGKVGSSGVWDWSFSVVTDQDCQERVVVSHILWLIHSFVYYEWITRELKWRPIWVTVWWKTKNSSWGIYTSHTHWIPRGTGTPKDREQVNRREVCECDGWVCDFEVICVPSHFRFTRKDVVLSRVQTTLLWVVRRTPCGGSGTVHGHVPDDELLNMKENGQFPDDPVRIKDTQIHYVVSQAY